MGLELELLYQTMTFALLSMVTEGEPSVASSIRGNDVRLQVLNEAGDVTMTVYGEGFREAGEQLVLASLQRLGVQGLRELHKMPLKKAAPLAAV